MSLSRPMAIRAGATLGAIAVALALPTLTVAAPAPVEDSVTGSAAWPAGAIGLLQLSRVIRVEARSGPSGEAPTGTTDDFIFGCMGLNCGGRAEVTCVNVVGTRAVIGFKGPPFGTSTVQGFETGFIQIADNGSPGVGRDVVDVRFTAPIIISPEPSGAPNTTCPAPSDPATWSPGVVPVRPPGAPAAVAQDFVVTDAQPVPTSKDQCKTGGYVQFGFKNQGECVAFVKHGPKP